MFKSRRVGCYLNGFSGHGDEPENKELKLSFWIVPIGHELAQDISPLMADRLFRGLEGPDPTPAAEMRKADFSKIQIQMCNIMFDSLPDSDSRKAGVMVPSAAISNLRAAKVAADSPEFRLEFDVVVPMDSITMRLVEQYYKATCYLTMEEIQRRLEEKPDVLAAIESGLQDAADEAEDQPRRRKRGKEAAAAD